MARANKRMLSITKMGNKAQLPARVPFFIIFIFIFFLWARLYLVASRWYSHISNEPATVTAQMSTMKVFLLINGPSWDKLMT